MRKTEKHWQRGSEGGYSQGRDKDKGETDIDATTEREAAGTRKR